MLISTGDLVVRSDWTFSLIILVWHKRHTVLVPHVALFRNVCSGREWADHSVIRESQQCVSGSENIWPHLLISKWPDVGPVVQFLKDKPGWLIWSCVPLLSMSLPSTCADMRGGDFNWAVLLKRWARPHSIATSQKRLAFHTATNRMPFVSLS